jgi:hypothetical protein
MEKSIAVAIEGDIPAGVQVLAQGEGSALGTRKATKWAVIRVPVEQARSMANVRAVYPASQGIGGWHYTRRPMRAEDIPS